MNLSQRVCDITNALKKQGINADVRVKKTPVKREQYLDITVNQVSLADGKTECADINQVLLNMLGYGTSMTSFEDGVVVFQYTPLKEHKQRVSERFGSIVENCLPAAGRSDNYKQ